MALVLHFHFSIAAINDTDSESQWEPLAPTKEAHVRFLSISPSSMINDDVKHF